MSYIETGQQSPWNLPCGAGGSYNARKRTRHMSASHMASVSNHNVSCSLDRGHERMRAVGCCGALRSLSFTARSREREGNERPAVERLASYDAGAMLHTR